MAMQLCFSSTTPILLRGRGGALGATKGRHLSVSLGRNVRRARLVQCTVAAAGADTASTPETEKPTTVTQVVETPGGYIVDAKVKHKKRTSHTMVIGKEFVAEISGGDVPVPPEVVVESVFDFFIHKKHDLTNTEGMQDSGVFPINYFSLRQVFYVYPEAREYLQEQFKKRMSN